ncbi:unnamed protein product [Rotaria socialis]|uniref:Uncharacterized protein n=1 Tax=Rotaria socialis TaxID=392032 RepID=A0A819B4M4_9BILA|nr:unnamed protein product [Rotaria socialis]
MTNRKYTWAPLVDDDMFIATWSPTDEELRRIKEFQEYERQGTAFENFLRFGAGTEPSVVFDEVLFLGTLNHGSNLDLLERLKIGKSKCRQTDACLRLLCSKKERLFLRAQLLAEKDMLTRFLMCL